MFVLPSQLLCTSALLHYDPSPPVDRVHLLEDRTHITSAIPEIESRPGRLSERQSYFVDTKGHPPLQTSSSAHPWHLRGQSEDDPEREPIRVCASDCGGDAAAVVGHSETRPASILLRDGYISRGLDGRIALDLPDRLCVLSMRALKVHTCNQLVKRAAL